MAVSSADLAIEEQSLMLFMLHMAFQKGAYRAAEIDSCEVS